MNQSFFRINKFDTEYLKGVGILLIMFHNLFHLMKGSPGENEFYFNPHTISSLIDNIESNPLDITKQFFSFFGHFGVQVFIFLSGYGLVIKYMGKEIEYIEFLKERFQKLYPILVLGIIFIFIYQIVEGFIFPSFSKLNILSFLKDSLLRLSLLSNLIPGQALILCGPWWFYSLIFQLYILFPFIFKLTNKQTLMLVFAQWFCQFVIVSFAPNLEDNIRYNFFGHIGVFSLGIYFAKNRIENLTLTTFILAILLFIGSFFNVYLWVMSFITIPIIILFIYKLINPSPISRISKVILFFGANSMYIFVVHGFLRNPFILLGNQSVLMSLVSALLYLIWVLIITKLFKEVLHFSLKVLRISSS